MRSMNGDRVNATTPVELIFMGTGTSSCVPHVDCLTRPPEATPCHTCLSTLTPEGKRNARRNTSAIVRLRGTHSENVTVLIDCGKSFQSAAVEWFPKYGLRRIDAVLITHAHADAMNGLDDLRGWTLHSAIQPHIDLYVSMNTFREVQRAFPYLISKEYASGGGDVPEFKWHIIEDGVPFEIGGTGIQITPFAVHHGRVFTPVPPVDMPMTPHSLSPASTAASSPNIPGTPIHTGDLPTSSPPQAVQPYLCFGFVIQDAITYISDVSHIPEHVWSMFEARGTVPPVLVLDCLRILPHTSHFGVEDSVTTARRMKAKRTYLLGFSHDLHHDDWVAITETAGGENCEGAKLALIDRYGLRGLREGDPVWVRPAFDGLRVFVSADGGVRDTASFSNNKIHKPDISA